MSGFVSLGIIPEISEYLKKRGIINPMPIQKEVIPAIFKGRNIIGRAQTGTGKTLAYLLPLVQRIKKESSSTQVIIMAPTRELSRQIYDVLSDFSKLLNVDSVGVIGGRTIENQIQKLKRNPHIIVGTPGRLIDHIRKNTIDLTQVKTVVLDEADQMLAAGFREDIEILIDMTPKKCQILMLSATITEESKKLARKYVKAPFIADVSEKEVASTVEQRIYETTEAGKLKLLVKHLKEMNPYMAVVFCNTREGAYELAGEVYRATHMIVDQLHGDMTQGQRNHVIRQFSKAAIQVLVASDIAARGLDVEGVTHVFNYDIPTDLKYYVHRIGRTGRAGTKGMAITYVTPKDAVMLRKLEKSIHETLTRYDERGRVKRVRQAKPKRRVVTPGMYKPTKKKEHKALGHKGRNMRQRRKKTL